MIDAPRRARPAALLLLALTLSCGGAEEPIVHGLPRGTLSFETASGTVQLDVAIADDPEERAQGLMHVPSLGEDEGMVFLHDEPTASRFTMRNTLIPLSLATWGPNGRVSSIIDMDPCRTEPCPVYDPGGTWIGAVEANQGFFDRRGVAVGDRVILER